MLNDIDIEIMKESLSFWDKLNNIDKETLISMASTNDYNKNSLIHSGDLECAGILIIKKGTIRVYIMSEDGRDITLYRMSDGDVCVLSASCVLQSITFDIYMEAVTDCQIIQISSQGFLSVMNNNVYTELFVYKMATERFSDVMWAFQQILFMSFDKRLAIFIIDEANRRNTDEIKITHEEIARFIGSAREVVSRMLKYFSDEGYVELKRGVIKVKDKKALKRII